MKIMSACANGSGTSLMLSRTARKAMEQLGYEITAVSYTHLTLPTICSV